SNEAFTIEGNSYQNCGSVVLNNLNPSQVTLSRTGTNQNDLLVTNIATGATLTISNEFANAWQGASSVQFGDGTTLNISQSRTFTWHGIANSVMTGSNTGTNVFAFGAGAEDATGGTNASGGSGTNTYQFGTQSGQATIHVNGSTGGTNELDFGSGISDNKLWFLQSGNDLQIDLMGSTSKVTINGWFAS